MSMPGRVFFDVTFTRTQAGAVGITRTVRRLLQHLREGDAGDTDCVPIAFHTRGFREVPGGIQQRTREGQAVAVSTSEGLPARLLRWLMDSRLRRTITGATPMPVLALAWWFYNKLTFDALSRGAAPVRFRQGDIVLLCDACWNYRVWVAARAAQRAGARVVVMVHDLIPLRQPEFCAPLLTAIFRHWLREMISCADAIVCNSAATMHDVQQFARDQRWELPPMGHFRLGSDLRPQVNATPPRRELLEFTGSGAPWFAAVGSIESRKNYGFLLRAFEQLWTQGHDIRLVVVGRPTPECKKLVDAMASHPERGRKFLPLFDASDGELTHVYSACRALVFPSLAEGFGLPLVEARTRGALVIASDIPVFHELADPGVLIFDRNSPQELCDRVLELARGDERRVIAPMEPFTWGDSARQLLAVTRQLLAAST
jgi:glycosyltransferase involved in cell wall biosynthesis